MEQFLIYFRPYVGPRVLEVGAGIGTFSNFILSLADVQELTTIEPAANLFPHISRRFEGNPRVKCLNGYIEDQPLAENFDAVVSVNVLEHIEDDVSYMRTAHRLLAPGGTILLFTPAFQGLYGTLDRQFGHFRRYRKLDLANKLRLSGFSLEFIRYFDVPGFFGWFFLTKILRRNTIKSSDVRNYDRLIMPWASKIESWWEPPIGKNLLAVGRKLNQKE